MSSRQSSGSSHHTRIAKGLVSPLGVTLSLPALILAVALVVIVIGGYSHRRSAEASAKNAFATDIELANQQLLAMAANAQPLLETWSRWLQSHPPASSQAHDYVGPLAEHMRAVSFGRKGLAWISWSTTDGQFIGLRWSEDGLATLTEHTGPLHGSIRNTYVVHIDGTIELSGSANNDLYDPRQRPFWNLATAKRGIQWSEPYVFSEGGVGITATQAVYDRTDTLLGVATIDFSLASMSSVLSALTKISGCTLAVVDQSQQILAWAGPQGEKMTSTSGIITLDQLDDPVVTQLLAHPETNEPSDSVLRFDVPGAEPHFFKARAVHIAGNQPWFVGGYAPVSQFTSAGSEFQTRAIWVTLLSLVIATSLALMLARTINRHRLALSSARTQVKAAQEEARELGSYRLVERLGVGGMGEVWLGTHRTLARPAAIKLISSDALGRLNASETTTAFERFEREAQVTATLRSRNTVEIYDFGVADDLSFFLVMELLDGFDLQDLIDTYAPIPVGRVIHLIQQACLSLSEAHQRGLVHRDIKPGNLFCCQLPGEGDIVKVLDFGLVFESRNQNQRLTQDGSVSGTPAYMAPEQALGEDIDGRADIYALACVAYTLATGLTVFDHDSSMRQMMAHAQEPPIAPSERGQIDLPAAFDQLIMRALAKDPADRPQTIAQFAQSLRSIALPESHRWTAQDITAWWSERDCRCSENDARKCLELSGKAIHKRDRHHQATSAVGPTETSPALSAVMPESASTGA